MSEAMNEIEAVLSGESQWAVVQGDSLDLLRRLPDGCIDMIATDPPYSSGGQFRGDRASATGNKYGVIGADFTGDNRDQRSFAYWSCLWMSEALRAAKPGAAAAVFTDWRQLPTTTDAFQAGGWVWRGIVPWDKTAARNVMGRFTPQCEYIVWGSAGAMPLSRNAPSQPGAIRERVLASEKLHQTGKPIQVMQIVVRLCERGGIVIDPFCGSASTGVACLREGFRFIGIEKTDAYYKVARDRMEAEAAQLSLAKVAS